MLDALQIAATGMQAQQLNVDTIANNLANVNTQGFKRARVAFHDLVTRMADSTSAAAPWSVQRGRGELITTTAFGVAVDSVSTQFDPGDLRKTDSAMDLAIAGEGFIELTLADGTHVYGRGGALKVNGDGLLSLSTGQIIGTGISVPDNAQALAIGTDGMVQAKPSGSTRPVDLGRIELVRFTNPVGLAPLGGGLYQATEASGEPITGRGGDERFGTLQQGNLEGSNVKLVDEMVNLMVAQRAYEASVKVAQAADEMLGMVNGLRK